jgi:hypothetical protein
MKTRTDRRAILAGVAAASLATAGRGMAAGVSTPAPFRVDIPAETLAWIAQRIRRPHDGAGYPLLCLAAAVGHVQMVDCRFDSGSTR